MERRHNFQNIAWFNDLYSRKILNLEPPYQRRSVWNQPYKDYFIDTILLNYPSPVIFLYEEINSSGIAKYNVVDGKQRLITVFEFVRGKFPVADTAVTTELRGKYFEELPIEVKNKFWSYTFLLEYLPTTDESIVNNVFDRINRNVAKLTPQELRHAKYSGIFISTVEKEAERIFNLLSPDFPRIAPASKKQMKDVEFVSQLILMIEDGKPMGYSKDELDEAFNDRDDEWEKREEVLKIYRRVVSSIKNILNHDAEDILIKSRFRNQVDFYTLFCTIHRLLEQDEFPEVDEIIKNIKSFITTIENETEREKIQEIDTYFFYTQSGVNRTVAREKRCEILSSVIKGEIVCTA